MYVGHVNLSKNMNGIGEHFIALIEALSRQGIRQHIIVRNESLARRVALYDKVTLGPTTGAPVVAYCLMPAVDVVHAHDERSAQAGLLMTLTRSVPYVITRRRASSPDDNPLQRSLYGRASGVICTSPEAAEVMREFCTRTLVDSIDDLSRSTSQDFEMAGNRTAADHLRIYYRASEGRGIPALLL